MSLLHNFLICRYEALLPLHKLWRTYADRLLDGMQGRRDGALEELFYGMDYHGAQVQVVETKDLRLAGKQGIIVKDTPAALTFVTREDQLVFVPKSKNAVCINHPRQDVTFAW